VSEAPLVMKFGGTSVGGGAEFVRAAGIVAGAAESRPAAAVVSAMAGTTDLLIGMATSTTRTTRTSTTGGATEAILERHLQAARQAVSGRFLPQVETRLRELVSELDLTLRNPNGNAAAHRDRVAGYGERLSAALLAGALCSLGVPARVVEDPIATDGAPGEAAVDATATRRRAARYVWPALDSRSVAVVPGYVGRAPDGSVTTLGRGGSDLSATVLGRALGSREVWILSDVDGVLDADPELVPEAGLVSTLSYREAAAFSRLGARVLHPKTMQPAAAAGMEVIVRSTFNPDSPGTRISAREGEPGIRCVGLRRGLALGHLSPEEDRAVFCVLGAESGTGVRALIEDPAGGIAVAGGIGGADDGALLRGICALEAAGVHPVWAGNTAAGLVFAVEDGAAVEAVRALHRELVRVEFVEEVA
jgi:aspartate kinase